MKTIREVQNKQGNQEQPGTIKNNQGNIKPIKETSNIKQGNINNQAGKLNNQGKQNRWGNTTTTRENKHNWGNRKQPGKIKTIREDQKQSGKQQE